MATVNYPGLEGQKNEHQEFTRKLADIKKEFSEYGAGINVVLLSARTAGDWLVHHIRKTDKAMAAYMRTAAAR
jgi:hemerythrin